MVGVTGNIKIEDNGSDEKDTNGQEVLLLTFFDHGFIEMYYLRS